MPRGKARGSLLQAVQVQARKLVAKLRNEIRMAESKLAQLKDDESRLSLLLSGAVSRVVGAPAARGRRGKSSGRVDWSTVLAQLPKQFKAANVRNVRGLKGKRSSEIFAAITRWIEAGTVKRKARGVYERA